MIWNVNVQVDRDWSIVSVVREEMALSPLFMIYIERKQDGIHSPALTQARFDVNKNSFIDNLPITIDSTLVTNLIRNLQNQ